jgi:sulfoxide reductase heme-binding subunit YedZ
MSFPINFLQKWNPLFRGLFVVHDKLSDFIMRYVRYIKLGLLIVAYASLLGFFFPQMAKTYGSFAQDILLVIVFVSPLSKLFRMRLLYQLMGLRRELGILFAFTAMVHGLSYITNPDWYIVFIAPFIEQPLAMLPRYVFGILALMFTVPLLITSNTVSVKLLRSNWKRVHWLVYPLFFFMLLHIFLPQERNVGGEIFGWVQSILVFGVYIFLKVLVKHNFVTPLRDSIDYVGRKYTEYRYEKGGA